MGCVTEKGSCNGSRLAEQFGRTARGWFDHRASPQLQCLAVCSACPLCPPPDPLLTSLYSCLPDHPASSEATQSLEMLRQQVRGAPNLPCVPCSAISRRLVARIAF
jgi:hypothetical protein